MFLRQEMTPRANGRNRIQSEGFLVHEDASHHLVNDGKDFAVQHHLGVGPDATAMQKTAAQQHIRHHDTGHESREAVFEAGLPVRFLSASGKGAH